MRNPLSVALFTLMLSPLAAFAQQQFATPEQAATALAEAISQPNEAALSEVLGDNWQQFLPTDGIDPAAVDRFQRDWQVKHVIIQQGDKAWLDVGSEAWRLPVPIVKASEGWRFDMAAGEEEILTRAIGRNELSAIAAMHAYVDAQQDYYHGYRFRIIAGRDDQSVALLAWPIAWGETGVMSFMIDQQDRVYQANLGEESAAKAQEITRFTPDADAGWQVAEP